MKALAGGYTAGLRAGRLVRACVFDSCTMEKVEYPLENIPFPPTILLPPPPEAKISYCFVYLLSDLSHEFTHNRVFVYVFLDINSIIWYLLFADCFLH